LLNEKCYDSFLISLDDRKSYQKGVFVETVAVTYGVRITTEKPEAGELSHGRMPVAQLAERIFGGKLTWADHYASGRVTREWTEAVKLGCEKLSGWKNGGRRVREKVMDI